MFGLKPRAIWQDKITKEFWQITSLDKETVKYTSFPNSLSTILSMPIEDWKRLNTWTTKNTY